MRIHSLCFRKCSWYVTPLDLPQHRIETVTMYFFVMRIKTTTSFWNISKASAPIHMKVARVK